MFEYDDNRKVSRAAHDSPVSPPSPWDRRGVSEKAYMRDVRLRADSKHTELASAAYKVIDRANAKEAQLRQLALTKGITHESMRVIAGRIFDLVSNVRQLEAELILAQDSFVAPWHTVELLTGVIRRWVELPLFPRNNHKPQVYKAPPSTPAPTVKIAPAIQPYYPKYDGVDLAACAGSQFPVKNTAEFLLNGKELPERLQLAISTLTFPTKLETAQHHSRYFRIELESETVWRVYKGDVKDHHKAQLELHLAQYRV